jgi:hypothetical protein
MFASILSKQCVSLSFDKDNPMIKIQFAGLICLASPVILYIRNCPLFAPGTLVKLSPVCGEGGGGVYLKLIFNPFSLYNGLAIGNDNVDNIVIIVLKQIRFLRRKVQSCGAA